MTAAARAGGAHRWGFGRARWSRVALQLASVAAVAAAWEVAGRFANPLLLPPLSSVLRAWVEIAFSGELPRALALSLIGLVIGLGLALVVGIGAGVTMGRFRRLGSFADTLLALMLVVPIVGLIPMLVVAFGLDLRVRVVTVFLFAVPIVAMNSFSGTRAVDARLVEMATSLQAGNRAILLKVVLPAAVPGIMAGVRLGIGRAVVGMVTAELLIVSVGIGLLIQQYSGFYQTAKLYATILSIVAVGVIFAQFGQWIDRTVTRHHGRQAAFVR